MKRRLIAIAKVLLVLALLGALLSASGIVPITASSRHWLITRWFFQFSKHRSVSTHTVGLSAPPLDDPQLVFKGAAHFELACRACHGSPDSPQPGIASHMTPRPPNLATSVPDYDPEELFYIVKHGIKFTGMPAWPTQVRDDEVWAMTAFLRRYPDLDPDTYRQLVEGPLGDVAVEPIQTLDPAAIPEPVVRTCARCHDIDGSGRGGVFPALAGQKHEYLAAALVSYARGERHSGIMEPIAAALPPEQIEQLAAYFANIPPGAPVVAEDDAAEADRAQMIERGRRIAVLGIPAQGVPSCIDCHGPAPGPGHGHGPTNPNYPILAGQAADYLVLQLTLFKEGRRGGSPYAHLMEFVATGLTEAEMRDVATYFESLSGPESVR